MELNWTFNSWTHLNKKIPDLLKKSGISNKNINFIHRRHQNLLARKGRLRDMYKLGSFLYPAMNVLLNIAFLGLLILVISLPSWPFLLGKSVNLSCNRLQVNYILCQEQRIHFYGLWSESVTSLKVTNTVIKEYKTHSDRTEYTGRKIYFKTNNGLEELYDYRRDSEKALNDQQRINNFILGSGNPFMEMKLNKSFREEIELIFIGFYYGLFTVVGLAAVFYGLSYVREFLQNRLGKRF